METAIVAWTARVSIACYLTWAVAAILRKRGSAGGGLALGVYAAGWVCMVAHVAAAFEFVHGWSHAAAWEHTARQTAEVTGIDWGGGLYFNDALVLIWGGDLVWRISARKTRTQPPFAWTIFVQAYLIFMIFNATVVFGPRGWIWTACGLAVSLGGALFAKSRLQSN